MTLGIINVIVAINDLAFSFFKARAFIHDERKKKKTTTRTKGKTNRFSLRNTRSRRQLRIRDKGERRGGGRAKAGKEKRERAGGRREEESETRRGTRQVR